MPTNQCLSDFLTACDEARTQLTQATGLCAGDPACEDAAVEAYSQAIEQAYTDYLECRGIEPE